MYQTGKNNQLINTHLLSKAKFNDLTRIKTKQRLFLKNLSKEGLFHAYISNHKSYQKLKLPLPERN